MNIAIAILLSFLMIDTPSTTQYNSEEPVEYLSFSVNGRLLRCVGYEERHCGIKLYGCESNIEVPCSRKIKIIGEDK